MDKARLIGKQEGMDARDDYLDSLGLPHSEGTVGLANDAEIRGIQNNGVGSAGTGIETQHSGTSDQEAQPNYCVKPRVCGEDANIDVKFQLTYNPRGEIFDYTFYTKYRYGWRSDYKSGYHPEDPEDYLRLWRSSNAYEEYIGPRWPTDVLTLAWDDGDRLMPYMPPWEGCDSVPCAIVEEKPYTRFIGGSYSGKGIGIEVDGYHMAYDNGPTGDETEWTPPVTTGIMLEKGPEFVDYTRLSAAFTYVWKGERTKPDITVGYPPSFSISATSERFEAYQRFQHTRGADDTERDTFEIRVDEVL
ncbi:hypothetical protein [Natrinema marinum]|uniref:hypothetical protein n=1 Tax=Natrinema marinum TaxID=2961598 RepID=UPI0020C8BCC9|nr:hypothetical protein [Natrinema marinum]